MADGVHIVLRSAFKSFEADGVRWALLRVPAGGLQAPQGDIDLFVHRSDVERINRLLSGVGFTRVPRRGQSAHFVRYDPAADEWLWVHASTEIGFGPGFRLTHQLESTVESVTHVRDGVRVIAPGLRFWLLLWHCLVEKGHIAPRHRPALLADVAAAENDPARTMFGAALGSPELPSILWRAVLAEDWAELERHATEIRARPRPRSAPFRARVKRKLMRIPEASRQWRRQKAITVAVLGPDGAGKSTLVAGIRESLPLHSIRIYMGLSGGALRRVKRLRVPGLVFAATAAVIWARYIRARYHAARGQLVVFERYTYDAVAPHPRRLTPGQRLARRLSGRLCPSPDLVLLLDAPGEVLHARSGAYSAALLEDWRQHFLAFAAQRPNCIVIDATCDNRSVRTNALEQIWRRQRELWRELQNDAVSRSTGKAAPEEAVAAQAPENGRASDAP